MKKTKNDGVIFYKDGLFARKTYLVSTFIGDDGKPTHTTAVYEQASVFSYEDRINIANEIRRKGGNLSLRFKSV